MLEREVKSRYRWELGLSLLLYAVVLTICLRTAKGVESELVRAAVMMLPAIPVFITVWVLARQFKRLDEFVRLRSLESLAIAAAVTAGLTFTYGFLESVGFPRQSMFWVWMIMGGTWGMHSCLRNVFSR